jgi:hypothetical protein
VPVWPENGSLKMDPHPTPSSPSIGAEGASMQAAGAFEQCRFYIMPIVGSY